MILLSKIKMAEGVGFEPTVALRLLLISSQMPLTTQPPFQTVDFIGEFLFLKNSFFTVAPLFCTP